MPWTTTTATRSGELTGNVRRARSAARTAPRARGGLDRQLIADRQATNALARRREDRVAERRRDRRHARLAHTAHRLRIILAGDDVDADLLRRSGHAGHLIGIEVVLLDAPVLVADLAERGDADAHDGRAFHL